MLKLLILFEQHDCYTVKVPQSHDSYLKCMMIIWGLIFSLVPFRTGRILLLPLCACCVAWSEEHSYLLSTLPLLVASRSSGQQCIRWEPRNKHKHKQITLYPIWQCGRHSISPVVWSSVPMCSLRGRDPGLRAMSTHWQWEKLCDCLKISAHIQRRSPAHDLS